MSHPKVIDAIGVEIKVGVIVVVAGTYRDMRVGRVIKISKTGKSIEIESFSTATLVAPDVDPSRLDNGLLTFRIMRAVEMIDDDWYDVYDTVMVLEEAGATRNNIERLIERISNAP